LRKGIWTRGVSIKLPSYRLVGCDFFEKLVFFCLADGGVYRCSVFPGAQPALLWNAQPPYRMGGGLYVREVLTAITTDSSGVLVANTRGQVKRIYRFQKDNARFVYPEWDEGTFATALKTRGSYVYAVTSGKSRALWRTPIYKNSDVVNKAFVNYLGGELNEGQNSKQEGKRKRGVFSGKGTLEAVRWERLCGIPAGYTCRFVRMEDVKDWLCAAGSNWILFFCLSSGKAYFLDGSEGTFAGDINDIAAGGRELYIGGRGITRFRFY
jgi:hypothetical protein